MKQLSQDTLLQAIFLLKQGKSVWEVAGSTGLSKSMVRRLRKSHCFGLCKPKGGRPKVLSAADERYCVRQVTKNCISRAAKVVKELEKVIGRKVSAETVPRALSKAGLGAIEKPKKPLLSAMNIQKRLSWCIAHNDWKINDWKRVIWSDGTKVNRFNSEGRTWAWIRLQENLKSHHVKMTAKPRGGSIMLWSAINYAGVSWMCKINGNIDKALYKEILEDELERTMEHSIDKLGLERHQVIFSMTMILRIRPK